MRLRVAFAAAALIFAGAASAQDNPALYSVAYAPTWMEDSQAALSLTWDDSAVDRIPPLTALEQYGFRGTFYLNTAELALCPTCITAFTQAHIDGHEIGNHTVNHSDLPGLTEQQIRDEWEGAETYLRTNITGGEDIISAAYPGGAANALVQSVTAETSLSGRTTFPYTNNGTTPSDWYFITEIGRAGLGPNGEPLGPWSDRQFEEGFRARVLDVMDAGAWGIEVYHAESLVPDRNVSLETTNRALRLHLEDLRDNMLFDRLWVATVGDVTKYIFQRDGTTFSAACDGGTTIIVSASHSLDPATFNLPMTVLVKVPSYWSIHSMTASQGATLDVLDTQVQRASPPFKFVRVEGVDIHGGNVMVTGPSSCWPTFAEGPTCQ